jgi:hypothetical protein
VQVERGLLVEDHLLICPDSRLLLRRLPRLCRLVGGSEAFCGLCLGGDVRVVFWTTAGMGLKEAFATGALDG